MTNQRRYGEIDLVRALAIIGMIIYHSLFILDRFDALSLNLSQGPWDIFGDIVRVSFLGLVGVSLVISKQRQADSKKFISRQIYRFLQLSFMALIVSLATYFVEPREFVRFGILHLIAVGVFIGTFFADKKYLSLVFGIAVLLISSNISGLEKESYFLYALGSDPNITPTLDYFPLFPWIAVIFFGISLGGFVYGKGTRPGYLPSIPRNAFIEFLSKHSLTIYLLHVPIILLILVLLRVIPLTKILAISESLANIV